MKESKSVFVVLLLAVALTGCQTFGTLILHDPTLFAKGWAPDSWTKNTTIYATGKTFNFDFPNKDGVHTIEKPVKGLKVGSSVSITYEITGENPTFIADGATPTVGFYIGKGRIYSNYTHRFPLKLGKQTLTVQLTPDKWSTVDGVACDHDQARKDEFNLAVKDAVLLGICFGDTHGYAHGANLTGGNAHFNCISFTP